MTLTPTGLRFMGQRFPCSIGKGGVRSDKREGDGATPTGTHRVVGMFYRPDRITAPQPWAMPIGITDLWSDASGDAHYNQHVKLPYVHSHEVLRRADPLYDLVLITDYNWPKAKDEKGSAIFLHSWRRPRFPTEGCIAFRADHLLWIARRVSLGTEIIVPQGFARQP